MLIIREALAAMRRTPMLSILTATVIAISLALIGIFALLSVRTSESLEDYRGKLPIEAYFDPAINSEAAGERYSQIVKSYSDITTKKFISKEDALREYMTYSGEDLQKVVGYNPLPAGMRMTFLSLSTHRATEIISALKKTDGIKEVIFDGNTLSLLEAKKKTLLTLTYALGGFLLLVSIALAGSLARLAMESRRDTIKAMSMLGAARRTIILPYCLEGMTSGVVGGLAAAGAVFSLHEFALPRITPELSLGTISQENILLLFAANIILGAALALVGCLLTALRVK